MSDPVRRRELLEILDALCDDRLDERQRGRLHDLLKDDAEAQRTYLDYLDTHLALVRLMGRGAGESPPARRRPGQAGRPGRSAGRPTWTPKRLLIGVAAAVLLAVTIAIAVRDRRGRPGGEGGGTAGPDGAPRLAQSTGAKFFGGGAVRDGSRLAFGEDYALTDGAVEVAFADGARAIIEAPAVFEVADRARLTLKLGRCSVYAPTGAEGFRVTTPVAEVVDLGTRFSVDVAETGRADVQVVEGLAEVLPKSSAQVREPPARLATGQARRYAIKRRVVAEEIAFDASGYRPHLPDRVVAYTASERPGGGVGSLRSVSVQRGGTRQDYRAEDLIGIDLIHFRADRGRANIATVAGAGDPVQGDRRGRAALLDRDADLDTGVINPGGSPRPLRGEPVLNDPEDPRGPDTPGLAVRFREPVVNAPGPDVVFFELQVIVHPERGDAFHVSPLRSAPGLRAHTVRAYDIDLASPEARMIAPFRLYEFDAPPRTLGELQRGGHNGGSEHPVRAKALAVGIDLSDLGYGPGQAAEGLFFQDAQDDQNQVDPVFIAGLPPAGRPSGR